MSKYAKINRDSVVENVIVCDDSKISLFEGDYVKVTTSTREAGIGGSYNKFLNKFIDIKPYPSWILTDDLVWVSPIGDSPKDGDYEWNEDSGQWNKLTPGKLQPTENHVWDPELDEWILP